MNRIASSRSMRNKTKLKTKVYSSAPVLTMEEDIDFQDTFKGHQSPQFHGIHEDELLTELHNESLTESESMMRKSTLSINNDLLQAPLSLHGRDTSMLSRSENKEIEPESIDIKDEGNDTINDIEEDEDLTLAQTVSMLDSRKQRYNAKWYDNQILLLKSNPNLMFDSIDHNKATPQRNMTRSRTLPNTPRIGINVNNKSNGINSSVRSDKNVSKLYRRLTKNYHSSFMLKTWKFWHLWSMTFCSSFVLLFTVIEWKDFGETYLHIQDGSYLSMVFIFSYSFAIFGHLYYGYLFDTFAQNKILYLAFNTLTRNIDIIRYVRYWRDIEIVVGYLLHLVLAIVFGFLYIWLICFDHVHTEWIYFISSIVIFICLGCDVILIPIIILDDFGYQYAHQNVSLLYTAFLPSVILMTIIIEYNDEKKDEMLIDYPNCIGLCSILSLLSFVLCTIFAKFNSYYLENHQNRNQSQQLWMSMSYNNNTCCCWQCICCCFCVKHKQYHDNDKMYKVHSSYFNADDNIDHNGNKVTPSSVLKDNQSNLCATD